VSSVFSLRPKLKTAPATDRGVFFPRKTPKVRGQAGEGHFEGVLATGPVSWLSQPAEPLAPTTRTFVPCTRRSTFKDPDFHGDGSLGAATGGAAFPPPPQTGLDGTRSDGAPPDLKRSS